MSSNAFSEHLDIFTKINYFKPNICFWTNHLLCELASLVSLAAGASVLNTQMYCLNAVHGVVVPGKPVWLITVCVFILEVVAGADGLNFGSLSFWGVLFKATHLYFSLRQQQESTKANPPCGMDGASPRQDLKDQVWGVVVSDGWKGAGENAPQVCVSESGDICGCLHYFDSVVPRRGWRICIPASSIFSIDTNADRSGITGPESPWERIRMGLGDKGDQRMFSHISLWRHPRATSGKRWKKCLLDTSWPRRACFLDSLVSWTSASLCPPPDSYRMRMR